MRTEQSGVVVTRSAELSKPVWPDREPVTAEFLAKERKRSLEIFAQYNTDGEESEITEFTCDGCGHAPCCSLAFDHYNTNGDCLASK
jgi:lysozyme family protein